MCDMPTAANAAQGNGGASTCGIKREMSSSILPRRLNVACRIYVQRHVAIGLPRPIAAAATAAAVAALPLGVASSRARTHLNT